jgi:hypothetical protein
MKERLRDFGWLGAIPRLAAAVHVQRLNEQSGGSKRICACLLSLSLKALTGRRPWDRPGRVQNGPNRSHVPDGTGRRPKGPFNIPIYILGNKC